MTILKFFRKDKLDFVAVNDSLPIVQRGGGCTNMFQTSAPWDGVWISDKPIKGWLPGVIESGYFYARYPDYGSLMSGSIRPEQAKVAGFEMKPKVWWRTGNEGYRLRIEQMKEYINASDKNKLEILKKAFPEEVKKPKVAKKEPAPKVEEQVPL